MYTINHKNTDSVNCRCQQRKCGGQCTSGLDSSKHVLITAAHKHTPNFAYYEVLLRNQKIKDVASSDTHTENRRTIRAVNSDLSDSFL